MDEAVCEICGSREKQEVMVNCAQCNACRHRYCLEVVAFEMKGDWYCYECQKKANGDPKPPQGKQTPMLDNDRRNMVHQIGLKTPQRYENSKVKFIPCEEAVLLSKERQPAYNRPKIFVQRTHRHVRPASPPNVKPLSSVKCISPSRQVCPVSPRNLKQICPASTPNVKPLSSVKCISPSRQICPASLGNVKQICPASTPNVKPLSSVKCISPSRQVRPASPGNVKQIRPTSPRSVKQPSSIRCVSPSRSEAQVFVLKRCAFASQNPVKIDDINMRQKIQSGATTPLVLPHSKKGEVKEKDHQIQDGPKEEKVASADKGKINSQAEDKPRQKSAFNTSDADIGCESGMKSLHHKIDMPVIFSSSAEYARRPPPAAICWTGCFHVSDGANRNLGEFKAYYPSQVSSKVCDVAKKMPNNLQLEIFPRMNHWPKRFERIRPVYEDIGLLFFSSELDGCERKHPHLLETYCSFVMKAYIDDMMLLIYSSEVLPPDSQWIDGELYLWGVFVKANRKSNPALFGSIAT